MKNIITIKNMNYTIPYGKTILRDVSLEVKSGEFIGILGRNGSGKTTLLDILQGLRPATSGSISVLDENPADGNRNNLHLITSLSHDANIKGSLTVEQYLKFYSSFYENYMHEEESKLIDYFSLIKSSKVGTLSTGQMKKMQFIGAICAKPELLLIDEVTAVMDPETREQFFSVIQDHRQKYPLTIVIATNIAEDLVERVDRVIFVTEGVAIESRAEDLLKLFNVEKKAC